MNDASAETIRCGSKDVPHNAVKWRSLRNRHTTTRGNDWGWIEGAPENICWSNDTYEFDAVKAAEVCKEHNDWLENRRPIELRIIECRERIAIASKRVEQQQKLLEQLNGCLVIELNELHRLTALKALGKDVTE